MTTYTLAFSARSADGWAYKNGKLTETPAELGTKEQIEEMAENLNEQFGYNDFDGAFLKYYAEVYEENDASF